MFPSTPLQPDCFSARMYLAERKLIVYSAYKFGNK